MFKIGDKIKINSNKDGIEATNFAIDFGNAFFNTNLIGIEEGMIGTVVDVGTEGVYKVKFDNGLTLLEADVLELYEEPTNTNEFTSLKALAGNDDVEFEFNMTVAKDVVIVNSYVDGETKTTKLPRTDDTDGALEVLKMALKLVGGLN